MNESSRPYFLPPDLDLETLPAGVRAALEAIVQPAYEELVVQAPTALDRSAGMSLVFLQVQELIEQFERGRQMTLGLQGRDSGGESRDEDLQRYLRVIGAKDRAANFILRVRQFRAKHLDPFVERARRGFQDDSGNL